MQRQIFWRDLCDYYNTETEVSVGDRSVKLPIDSRWDEDSEPFFDGIDESSDGVYVDHDRSVISSKNTYNGDIFTVSPHSLPANLVPTDYYSYLSSTGRLMDCWVDGELRKEVRDKFAPSVSELLTERELIVPPGVLSLVYLDCGDEGDFIVLSKERRKSLMSIVPGGMVEGKQEVGRVARNTLHREFREEVLSSAEPREFEQVFRDSRITFFPPFLELGSPHFTVPSVIEISESGAQFVRENIGANWESNNVEIVKLPLEGIQPYNFRYPRLYTLLLSLSYLRGRGVVTGP